MTNGNQHIPSGYKPSPLGIIPEDWEVKRLGEVCTFLSTNTLSRNQLNDTNGEVRNIHYGDVLIKYPSIIDVRKQSIPFVNQEDYKESMNDFIEDGDVVLADTAEDETVGKACEIANVGSEKILSGLHTMLIRPQKGLFSPWFLGYQVNSVSYRKQLNALVQGIKVCSLGKQAVANTYFAVPPLPEQQNIVSVLSLWDTAIEKQTALIVQLTLRKRGLMQQLLTGKKRLKGFSGEWKEVRLGEVGKFAGGCAFNEQEQGGHTGIPFYKVSDMNLSGNESKMNIANNYVTHEQIERLGYIVIEDEAIIFAKVGAAIALERKRYAKNFIIDNNMLAYIPSNNVWFMKYWFDSISLSKYIQVGALPSYNASDLSIIKLKMPSLKEQHAIASVLVNADKEIEIQKQKLAAMQEQKKGLMQVLLTGKKRITTI
ncbi:MAG: restriction endonuclease subunit S [Bacteroidales bacterium]|nr:restriction endonuclease subunit S [Bacteroidales bacterium]